MMEILEEQYVDRFVGREKKIEELKAKIWDNHIVVVKGNRGIGKTNLMWVVHKALETEGKDCHFVRAGFRDQMGEIFKLPWFNRIQGLSLSVIAVGGGVSWSKEEALRQSVKKSKEKIIFVENAHELDKEALESIFDAVCMNDKLRFVLEVPTPHMRDFKLKAGSYSVISVEQLSYEDTVKLVKNAYDNFSNDVVEKIATKSNGYPYVARVLVFICLDKESNKIMHEFLDTLKDDEMHRLDQIHKEVLETLREDAQGVIKKLAIAPQMLPYKLIEAFCGEETNIRDIVERGILRTEKELYWIYHPLFRDYLRETPGVEVNKNEIYYKAMGKIKNEFHSIHVLFEVSNEPDLFDALIKIVENYQALNYVAVQCYTWGKLGLAINAWSRILTKSQDEKNKEWEAIAIGYMGNVYKIKGELDKALDYFWESLKLSEKLGKKEGIALNFGNIGNVYQIKGELDKALEYLGKALKLSEELGEIEAIASQFGNIGIVYQTKGELDKALDYFWKSLKLNEELSKKEGVALNFGNIGVVYGIKGELDKALDYFWKALELNEELGKKEGIALNFGNIGNVYQIKGELDKALDYFWKALELNEELGAKGGIASQFGNMGVVYLIKGELDKALEYYEKALLIFRDFGDIIQEARMLMAIGTVFVKRGENEFAIDYYLQAQELAVDSPPLFGDISKQINKLLDIKNLAYKSELY